ncbi:MAG: RidA family protein [Xanthomonadales bacterium]|nr:RidA family protein [Xanthomonadales bacterium]
MKDVIHTKQAPATIGPYSQAVNVGGTIYLSGQIPLDASSGKLIDGDFTARVQQVLKNLSAVCTAAGGNINDIVKLNVYLTDLGEFETVNTIMAEVFNPPYPARAAVQVAALPKGTDVEMDAIMVLPPKK